MTTRSFSLLHLIAALAVIAVATKAPANVWLDEDFEGATVFTQLDGASPGEKGWDPDSANALANPVSSTTGYAVTGSVSTDKAFAGDASYQLQTGETIVVGPDYQDPANGNFIIFQFAVNVDPIPAAGTVATFRWDHDMDDSDPAPDHSFYVRLESDGTTVDIVAGEDLANDPAEESSIGSLAETTDWAYITVLVQKDGAPTSDSRFPFLGNVEQGVYFFNSSETAAAGIDFAFDGAATYVGRGWSFTVDSGSIYLDEMYWDGGKDDTPAESNFRPFDSEAESSETSVTDWQLVQ